MKSGLRSVLESNEKEVTFTLKQYTEMLDDDDFKSDTIDMLQEALMRIADGQDDPVRIAQEALKKYPGL